VDPWKKLWIAYTGITPLSGTSFVAVKNLDSAIEWYCDVLDVLKVSVGTNDLDLDRNYAGTAVTLGYPTTKGKFFPVVTLTQIQPDNIFAPTEHHPILFTKDLNQIHSDLTLKAVAGPIQQDSGGNHFFQFTDLEGNTIEVCLEPGKKFR
jgi:catechol 2,3-dioxygenase-like lactoylglutathione lyase family enzyme